ncbi:MAG: RNB domain-containing ribonuclease [Acidimicrobiales bacterium]|nr:RNB domain-containing ribonuclease [Acidimicrobiales bacterium]
MTAHRVRSAEDLGLDFDSIRADLEVPGDFASEVIEAAERAAASPRVPDHDATDIEFVTIDPEGSRDLDQAVSISATGDGWRVHYAIADVAAWVSPSGPVDVEARNRTQTFYAPDRRISLHPPVLGEGAASLLPDGPRPAALWTIDVAADGTTTAVDLRRAMVRSRAKLSYTGVQKQIDAGEAPAPIAELPALGAALLADARRRGAIDLGLPEQEVERNAEGRWTVSLRHDLAVETWNAQVSLLTGRAAARIMLDGGFGVLRTLPPPDDQTVARLRAASSNLGIDWPDEQDPGAVLDALDRSDPKAMAFADLAAELLRGAGYTTFRDGATPAETGHGGVGAPYAHVTAPLRRLVDRFGTEACLAIVAGRPVPGWVDEALDSLPTSMASGDAVAKKLDRAVIDATEAFVLADRVGDLFAAHVVEAGDKYGTIVIDDPAIRARCDGGNLPLGGAVKVRLAEADVQRRVVRFERVV